MIGDLEVQQIVALDDVPRLEHPDQPEFAAVQVAAGLLLLCAAIRISAAESCSQAQELAHQPIKLIQVGWF